MRILLAAAVSLLMTGCATNVRSPALAGLENVQYELGAHDNEYVKSAAFSYEGQVPDADALPMCVAKVVQNRSVTLKDSSRGYVGAYSGMYYGNQAAREAGGGTVIQYVSDDKKSIVAQGATSYSFGGLIPIQESVRFGLSAKVTGNARSLIFDRIERAQLNTGAVSNSGFTKVGAWSGARPEMVIKSLRTLADDLNNCLSQ